MVHILCFGTFPSFLGDIYDFHRMLTNLCASGDSSNSEHVSMKSFDDLARAGESIGLVDC